MTRTGVLGLIAGGGRLPFMVAEGARAAGLKVICVGFSGIVSQELAEVVDTFYPVAVARPGSWIRKLKRHGVSATIMVGRVSKARMFSPWRMVRYIPDWRALRIFYWRIRGRGRQPDVLLGAVADELATGGIILEDSTRYCQEHLATQGYLTRRTPNAGSQSDIEFGWPIAKQLGDLDIGQAVAVKEQEVIAVEAIEGTAEMIKRAGQYCRSKGWVLIKTSKPNQDMRFDVPCVGPDTIQSLADNGGTCLVIEAGKTLMLDKPQTIELAERLGIAVIAR